MGDTSKYKEEKQIALGILAHVDAGKTTLSESMLHKGGIVDNIGRVDKKNAFLDNYELEKERGITIFSKQAVFRIGNMRVTLLDTPGHIDFSAEMERTLQVLDYAVLVINGADGVQDIPGRSGDSWSVIRSRCFCLSTKWISSKEMMRKSRKSRSVSLPVFRKN